MSTDDNILQAVQTYQDGMLGVLFNLLCIVRNCNTRFREFEKLEANKGDTVLFDKPPRFVSQDGLAVPSFDSVEQRVQSLTITNARNINYAFSSQQMLLNSIDQYLDKFGRSAMVELATFIEQNVAQVFKTNTYRYYGDGITQLTTFQQIMNANAKFRNFGAPAGKLKIFINDLSVPGIVSSGLQQFAPNRNEKLAMSWELASYNNADYLSSNLLPVYEPGGAGNPALTPVDDLSITNISADGTTITLTSATLTNETGFIKKNDKATIFDAATTSKLSFLTFSGHVPSQNRVQFQSLEDADLVGGEVTFKIEPALISDLTNRNASISKPLVFDGSLTTRFLGACRLGSIVSGDALFAAMPSLGPQRPYDSDARREPETGISLRFTHGSLFGQNVTGNIHDCIWGSTMVPEYAMALAFPLDAPDL